MDENKIFIFLFTGTLMHGTRTHMENERTRGKCISDQLLLRKVLLKTTIIDQKLVSSLFATACIQHVYIPNGEGKLNDFENVHLKIENDS